MFFSFVDLVRLNIVELTGILAIISVGLEWQMNTPLFVRRSLIAIENWL